MIICSMASLDDMVSCDFNRLQCPKMALNGVLANFPDKNHHVKLLFKNFDL